MLHSFKEINVLNQELPFFSKSQKINKGLALVDLDGTIRSTKSGKQFINEDFTDQKLFPNIDKILESLNRLGYTIIGVSNQGGILAQSKTLRNTIKEMRYCLNLCRHLDRIYFAVADSEVWVMTRKLSFLDGCPLSWGTFSRYPHYEGIGDNFNLYGGFYKPNSGMLKLAIADWVSRYDLLAVRPRSDYRQVSRGISTCEALPEGSPQGNAHQEIGSIKPEDWINTPRLFEEEDPSTQLKLPIFMTGDRDEDEQAANAARIHFIPAKKFQAGVIFK